jgi:cellulose synthase/poly-beta-1,6-N-acetylglucosamine synthase-like glycosyltransferase
VRNDQALSHRVRSVKSVFWTSAALLAYTYCGYPVWLWLRSLVRRRPIKAGAFTPSISIAMVVRNESGVIERKLNNLLHLEYPAELSEIVVVSDGSSDTTNEILSYYAADCRVRIVLNSGSRGKAACLNDAIDAARGEIVVFTDARQQIEPEALRLLAKTFEDPQVGCASGELMLGDPARGETVRGMGLYWQIEKKVREMESASASVVGATGALYAVRRKLLVPVPAGTFLDDVYIPMYVARQGFRVIFVPDARAWDVADQGTEREFSRKVRTLSGNYQLLQLAPWLLTTENPLRFEFISHKLLRLIAPFFLIAALVSTLALHQTLYRFALALQIAFYALGLLGVMKLAKGPLARVSDPARTFIVLNTAALVAFVKFVSRGKVAWSAPGTENLQASAGGVRIGN